VQRHGGLSIGISFGVRMKPLLIGLLLDVSSSMALPLQRGKSETRLHSLEESIEDLIARARGLMETAPLSGKELFGIFAFGFGFGNLRSRFQGRNVPAVRHLLSLGADSDDVVDAVTLLNNWDEYRENISRLSADMLGTTPMVEAFSRAERLLDEVRKQANHDEQPVLLVVSDGAPTDPPDEGPALVRAAAERIQRKGAVIVSCFVGAQEMPLRRTLYSTLQTEWSAGAKLLFDCASPVATHPAFYAHLTEYDWEIPAGARLFTQLNQLEQLAEFSQLLLSPIDQTPDQAAASPPSSRHAGRLPVKVMVSYCHADSKYVSEDRGSLLSYLKSLEIGNVKFWCDRQLNAGDLWNGEIEAQLQAADVALVLVSQAFLNSSYCSKEAGVFIERRRIDGLRIVPVILSACDWERQPWLKETQVLPRDGRNIEEHFALPGKRKALYLSILNELRAAAATIAG
jgi:hypothetical protein